MYFFDKVYATRFSFIAKRILYFFHLRVSIKTISLHASITGWVVVLVFSYESNHFIDVNNNKLIIVTDLKPCSYYYKIFNLHAGGTADGFIAIDQYLLKNYRVLCRWLSDKNDEESASVITNISMLAKTTSRKRGLYGKFAYRYLCHTYVMSVEKNRLKRGDHLYIYYSTDNDWG